jgi:hypothetical protein
MDEPGIVDVELLMANTSSGGVQIAALGRGFHAEYLAFPD